MAKFGKLKKLAIKEGASASMTLTMLDPSPTLHMYAADETNKNYLSASLKNARERARIQQRTGITPGVLSANRERDRKNFAEHIVHGWDNVLDDDGKKVAFSKEVCREYLDALPDWIFDEVREFAATPANFIELPDAPALGN